MMDTWSCSSVRDNRLSDTMTKSLPRSAFEWDREFIVGARVPFSGFYLKVTRTVEPMCRMSLSCLLLCILRIVLSLVVRADNYTSTRGRVKWHDVTSSVLGLELQISIERLFQVGTKTQNKKAQRGFYPLSSFLTVCTQVRHDLIGFPLVGRGDSILSLPSSPEEERG